jgi:hypothetical protein
MLTTQSPACHAGKNVPVHRRQRRAQHERDEQEEPNRDDHPEDAIKRDLQLGKDRRRADDERDDAHS